MVRAVSHERRQTGTQVVERNVTEAQHPTRGLARKHGRQDRVARIIGENVDMSSEKTRGPREKDGGQRNESAENLRVLAQRVNRAR